MNAFESCDLPELVFDESVSKVERIDNEKWNDLARAYIRTKEQIKFLESVMVNIKESLIKMALKDHCIGGGLELQKVAKKGNIDYSMIPELDFVDLEKYRKPQTEYWKINEIQEEIIKI